MRRVVSGAVVVLFVAAWLGLMIVVLATYLSQPTVPSP